MGKADPAPPLGEGSCYPEQDRSPDRWRGELERLPCSRSSGSHVRLLGLHFLTGIKHCPPRLKPRGLLDIRLTQTRQRSLSVTGFPRRAPRSRGCVCYFTETSQQPRERTAFCISVSGC